MSSNDGTEENVRIIGDFNNTSNCRNILGEKKMEMKFYELEPSKED